MKKQDETKQYKEKEQMERGIVSDFLKGFEDLEHCAYWVTRKSQEEFGYRTEIETLSGLFFELSFDYSQKNKKATNIEINNLGFDTYMSDLEILNDIHNVYDHFNLNPVDCDFIIQR